MAYRIKNFENMSSYQIDGIFRRGRGLLGADSPLREYEDFNAPAAAEDLRRGLVPMPPAVVVDEELETIHD